jgi:hypothetical protein
LEFKNSFESLKLYTPNDAVPALSNMLGYIWKSSVPSHWLHGKTNGFAISLSPCHSQRTLLETNAIVPNQRFLVSQQELVNNEFDHCVNSDIYRSSTESLASSG